MPLTPNYRGNWNTAAVYAPGDVVTYQGTSWITTATIPAHATAPGTNILWLIFAQAGSPGDPGDPGIPGASVKGNKGDKGDPGVGVWRGPWSSIVTYVANDVVFRDGSTYIAVLGSTNIDPSTTSGTWNLVASIGVKGDKGDKGNPGLSIKGNKGDKGDPGMGIWHGPWDPSVAYLTDDIVSHNGSTFIGVKNSLNVEPGTANSVWNLVAAAGVKGDKGDQGDKGDTGFSFRWLGDWNPLHTYQARDAVSYSHSAFMCLTPPPVGTAPLTGADIHSAVDVHWSVMSLGVPFIFKGPWDFLTQYFANDVVSYNNSVYAASQNSLNVVPTDTDHWTLMIVGTSDTDPFLPLAGGVMTGGIVFHTGQTFPGAGAVDSVNGQTGVVTLDAGDVGADVAGAAGAAETAAEGYADGLISAEITRADLAYDPIGAASTAQSNAESYADGLAGNYDPAGAAGTAESNAEGYAAPWCMFSRLCLHSSSPSSRMPL